MMYSKLNGVSASAASTCTRCSPDRLAVEARQQPGCTAAEYLALLVQLPPQRPQTGGDLDLLDPALDGCRDAPGIAPAIIPEASRSGHPPLVGPRCVAVVSALIDRYASSRGA
jgi:hypothetical protein